MHPTIVIRGLYHALEDALKVFSLSFFPGN